MNLLYLHQYFTFPSSSGGTRSYDLATQFVKQGVQVTIVTSSAMIKDLPFVKRWTYIERDGIHFWILRCKYAHKMSIFRRILAFLEYSFFAAIKVCAIKADLVLATSTPLTIAIPAILKKKISKTPFIFEVRDVWPEGPIQEGYVKNKLVIKYLRWIEKYIYTEASWVVALSIGMKRDILSRVNVDKIEVIPNIAELERFENISSKVDLGFDLNGKKMILYAGTIGPVNDIMFVAKLAKRIYYLDKSIVFTIIGDGKQKKSIEEYCKQNGILNKNIFFLPPIPKSSLPYVYSLATMGSSFVWDFKIKWDNSANKVFDTLAAGRPLLINHQGWQADLIKEYCCGFILTPFPTEEEIFDFVQYVNDSNRIIEEGYNAKKVALLFSLPIAVQKYMKIINSFNL